jgi:uncharacterized phage protein gp47/JayE
MTTLPIQNYDSYVQTAAAAVQTSDTTLVDLSEGSSLLAVLEAQTGQTLWLQALAFLVLETTRLTTSSGSDVDTFGADFSFTRLPAAYAQGEVTFSRYVADSTAFVPVGAQVRTADGTQLFAVIADLTQPTYSSDLNGYTVPVGTLSATATVQAVNAGSQANVAANTVSLLVTNIAGITAVTNPTAFTSGVDAESDAAFKTRFANYINTRSLATLGAVEYAISSVQSGLTYNIAENTLPNGTTQVGYFTVTIDDGSGNPASTLLTTVAQAINAVRPVGSTFGVYGPHVVAANISMTISVAAGYTKATVQGLVSAAITQYVNSLSVGAILPYSILSKLAYDASPGISNVQSVLLNGGTADLGGGGPNQVVKIASLAID